MEMNPERWQRIKELFHAALEREPDGRRAFLDQACADDADARAEVESLIAALESDSNFLDVPAVNMAAKLVVEAPQELEAGRRIASYSIVGTLGEGGMGKVYLAQDTRLGRKVALKLLPASFTRDEERVHRFEQEARATSALNHPNILTIHEIGTDDGAHFIATEFVEGATLRERLRRGEMRLHEVLEIAIQVAAALAAAHAANIVHRDIKPENIMLRPDGYVKVLDFGLAKPTRTEQAPSASSDAAGNSNDSLSRALVNTQPGMIMGTIAYMSPEQARGLETDAGTDIWSLGVVLYEMIAGRPPFTGPTGSDVMVSVLNREPRPLAQHAPAVPSELERIVMKALSKERDDRYQTVKEMLIDMRRLKQRMEFEAEMKRSTPADEMPLAGSQSVGGQSSPASSFAPAAERLKQVTVLFADLHGFTSLLAETSDPEDMSAMMRGLWNRIDGVVMEHGGTVDRHMGDQLMALWGAQVAHEDDPEHAVRAALAMQKEVCEFFASQVGGLLGPPVVPRAESGSLARIGINTGTVLLSAIGTRGEFTATGNAVNIAHRLEQSAPAGSILISHDTYRHVRGIFDVQELELMNSGDRAEPLRTYSVERAKPRAFHLRTRGVEGVETRMIGREAELARMRDALQTVIEDREPQVVTVIGDAGLGKSRLLYEFSSEVELLPERVSVFNGRAGQWRRGLPYGLIRDVFSHRFGFLDGDSPADARDKLERALREFFGDGEDASMRAHFIGHLIGLDYSSSPYLAGIIDDAKQVRGRAFHYASQFFSASARASPTVIYLDDLHWADDGSLDFVDHLARTCGAVPLLILGFARSDLLARRPAWGEGLATHARLTLQPLTRRESRQLVEEILRYAQSIPHVLRELVVSAAEGNPFYVEELIKMLIDQKVILPAADRWGVDASRLVEVRVPPTLTGVLQARLDGLSAWEKTVLQRASVIGREFWDGALDDFARCAESRGETGEGDTRAALEVLRRKELIYRREASAFAGTEEYIFKHALLRSVAYENVLKRDRRRLHKEAAAWLVERSCERVEEYAANVAEHYEAAKELALAAEWYGRAGGQARASYAPEAAIGFYRKALDFMRGDAKSHAPETTVEASSHPESIKWYDGLGEVLTMQARYDEALEAYVLMRREAEQAGDLTGQARAWNGMTAVQEYQGDNRAALESARRAEQLARAAIDAATTNVVSARAKPESAMESGSEKREAATAKAELAVALNRQGLASHRLGDAAAVMELGQQILALSAEMGEGARHARANGLKLLGVAYEVSGHFAQADECFEQSLSLLKELGDRRNIGFMLNNIGVIAHLRGDYDPAVRRYEEALAIFREIGERTWELPTLGNLAGAQIGLENYRAAEANLQHAVAMTGPAGHFALSMIYCYLAEAYWGQNKITDALETARTALSLGQKTENQDYIASAWRILGLIAAELPEPVLIGDQTFDAAACFDKSLSVFAEMGAEAERARTLRDWARYERARGDGERGTRMWQESREIFSRLKMERELERMSELV